MHAFDVLGSPVRRRILDLLADGEQTSGTITAVIQAEFGLSEAGVSQHLRVLRDAGFASVRPEGSRRLYAVAPARLQEIDRWLEPFRQFWNPHLDALATELARGRRERRRLGIADPAAQREATTPPAADSQPNQPDERYPRD